MKKLHCYLLLPCYLLLLCSFAFAQNQGKSPEILKVDSQFLFFPESDFKNSSFSLTRQYLGISSGYPIMDDVILTGGLSHESSQYDWSDTKNISSEFTNESPIVNSFIHRASIGAIIKGKESTTIIKNFLNSSGDYLGGNPLTYGLLGIHSIQLTEDFSLAGVFIFNTQLEKDPSSILALGFQWNVNEFSKLELTGEILGPVLRYSHVVCDDLTLFLQAKRENREYRISPKQNREGVYYDSSTPVLTGITWKNQSSPFAISFGLGADVSRSFRIEDNAGREIVTRSGDIAPMASLVVKAGF